MNYIETLREAISKKHRCDSRHIESIAVTETYKDNVAWNGTVEVFVVNHLEAEICYAWEHRPEQGKKKSRYVTVLHIPPIDSPLKAVRTAIISEAQG